VTLVQINVAVIDKPYFVKDIKLPAYSVGLQSLFRVVPVPNSKGNNDEKLQSKNLCLDLRSGLIQIRQKTYTKQSNINF